jgi:hypothetical protein
MYGLFQKPEKDEWGSGVEALESALQLEKSVNQSLLDLHRVCADHNDPHVSIWSHELYKGKTLCYFNCKMFLTISEDFKSESNPPIFIM